MFFNDGPREHLGRRTDDILTPELVALRHLVGGFRDPLPASAQPPVGECDLCHRRHVTFAFYVQDYRDELVVISELHVCLGCVRRQVDASQVPIPQLPAHAGVLEESK